MSTPEQTDQNKPDTTKERPTLLRQLLSLAIPITIGGAVQTSYHLINAFWVGRLGADAVAAISICLPINMLLISLGSGLALAASILVAQNLGSGKRDQVNHVTAQSFTLMLLVALVISVIGSLTAPLLLEGMGVTESIFADTLAYLRVSFISIIFLLLSSVYQSILRGLGDAKAPLRIILFSVVINALLDPLLIFGVGSFDGFGVVGAAYGTFITQMISAYAGIRLMLKPRFGLTVRWLDLRPDWAMLGRLCRLGFPASVEQSMQALTVSVMTVLVTPFGTVAIAAYGLAFRVLTFTLMPAFAFSMAASILVGQSIGGGDRKQSSHIAKVTAALSFVVMAVIGAVFFFAAMPVVSFFVPNDAELIEHGTKVLQIFAISFPLSGALLALLGSFRGAGDTFNSMMLTIVGIWLIQLPLAYLMSRYSSLGEYGLWWASLIATVINAVIALIYFKSGRWQNKHVVATE